MIINVVIQTANFLLLHHVSDVRLVVGENPSPEGARETGMQQRVDDRREKMESLLGRPPAQ